ncbi:Type I restriction-modification system, specificity subunit S [Olavius algarvensis spirochete endosymbiont]|uniref:restriction endonuclease subunit S n=1 Tax=Olavius algarvensis spirochete endosymbiont TaxID=260710 RepID=UPI000F1429B4|nr:restriction endonuclease subunit S [Olavius algarvensis spirochete endosymbiont]VDA99857.1 Type I restriction-modification system, specificity subunit S [Olavius algarvensis spirochete endosymbiont]
MRSSYKKLGPFIREVKVKNSDLQVDKLLGVSITKEFIPSIANTVGTDMSKYKIVHQNQFAYGPVTSRNGDKISVALLQEEACIISTSYTVFEIVDQQKLLPEYLMMWFRRPEFDRYARYMSHGSVREIFGWDEMCDVELPVPTIEKQREIVREYHTIVDRIKLNEQLNQKLEETAQAIYKQWFVDFEFPMSKEHATEIGKPEMEGKPYKSGGGKMVWNDELDQEIPEGWEADSLTKVFTLSGGGTPKTDIPEYWRNDIPFFTGKDVTTNYYTLSTEKSITRLGLSKCSTKLYPANTTLVVSRGATTGVLALSATEMAMNQSCYAFLGKGDDSFFVHQTMLMIMGELKRSATGSTFNALVTRDYEEIKTIAPNKTHTVCFNKFAERLYSFSLKKLEEIGVLRDLLDTLLSKLTKAEATA